MKTSILLVSLCLLSAGAASAAIVAGDQLVSGSLGAAKVTGPNRSAFISPGWFAGGEYIYQITDQFGLGGELSWEKPHNKSVTVLGGGVGIATNADVYTIAALARFNFTPQNSWTPYVAAGPGLHYTAETVTVAVPIAPNLGSVSGSYGWRISAVAALGADYFCHNWLLGAQMRYQTFDSNSGGLAWAGRVGYKFGR